MKHTESTDNAVFWAAPVLLGLLMTFGGLLAGACLLSAGTIGLQMKPLAVCLPFAAGTMLTAGWSARRAPANRFVLGFLTGLSLLGCLFLLSLTLRDAAGSGCGSRNTFRNCHRKCADRSHSGSGCKNEKTRRITCV